MDKLTQEKKILDYCKLHKTITQREALNLGIYRLASRISDLAAKGFPIEREWITRHREPRQKIRSKKQGGARMSIFTINQDLEAILQAAAEVMEETGELPEDIAARITELNIEKTEKLQALAFYCKEIEGSIEIITKAQADLAKRKKSAEKRLEFLKDLIGQNLPQDKDGKKKLKTDLVTIYEKTTKDVVAIDPGVKKELPERFYKLDYNNPNKTALKDAILSGETIEGVWLEDHTSTVIKI